MGFTAVRGLSGRVWRDGRRERLGDGRSERLGDGRSERLGDGRSEKNRGKRARNTSEEKVFWVFCEKSRKNACIFYENTVI